MATILWIALIVLIFFPEMFHEFLSPGLYAVISVIVIICAIVATIQGKNKKEQQKAAEIENRAAAYVPPTGSVAAEIRATVSPPPTAQEMEQRRCYNMEARINNIIGECKAAARKGERKKSFTVRESWTTSSKEREYVIDCPESEKELRNEFVKRGFSVSFTKRTGDRSSRSYKTTYKNGFGHIDYNQYVDYYSEYTIMTVYW